MTKFGKTILDALYEEGVNFDAKVEIVFERFPTNKTMEIQTAYLYVSLETLKAGGIGRVYFREVGAFSDLWAMWDKKNEQIVLFVFASCERVPLLPVKAYRILETGGCCGNISDEDIV